MNDLTPRQQKDLKILIQFVDLFCRWRHRDFPVVPLKAELSRLSGMSILLCPECSDLVSYAAQRLRRCPLDPKPSCKKCPVHCYRPDYRQKIREIMAWSGKRMILRGRLDMIARHFF